MIIKINPLDTLIFRDGKPFGDVEGDNWANSFSFPNPTTIYGAIRSIYFSQNPEEFKYANKENDPTKNLKINGIFFKYDENLVFKKPFDIYLIEKDKKKKKYKGKIFSLRENYNTNNPLKYIFTALDEKIEDKEGFLVEDLLKNYKNYLLSKENFNFLLIEEVLSIESKIGIGLNKSTKNVQDGKLYRVGLNRYKGLEIIVDFEGVEIEEKGLLKLGGEGKGAFYEKIDDLELPKIEKIDSNIFKIVLLTPAIFKNGWYPDFLDENYEGEVGGIKLKLVAAAVGKPEYYGGWDIQNNEPKPMYKAVPTGSVYYFELENENDRDKIFKIFNYKSIVEEKLKKEGYGICVIGKVKEEERN